MRIGIYKKRVVLFTLAVFLTFALSIAAQSTAFSYQGKLADNGNPANGNYEVQFKLFDALAGGAQVGGSPN